MKKDQTPPATDTTPKDETPYAGFEQGPIRPPSEAASLLIRITRNCPWNRCTFCPVYKGEKFSLRPVDHVIQDIDTVHRMIESILQQTGGELSHRGISNLVEGFDRSERMVLSAAINWIRGGMESIFLQDANSLIIKPDNLIKILSHLKMRFPHVKRITSYARSHTICRIPATKLKEMFEAGLNRIHIGMESGADSVLKLVKKGVTQADHISAGQKVVACGMELSEYLMPGLGGRELSQEHAEESAHALTLINPHFIRFRTLALPNHVELKGMFENGTLSKQTDTEIARELNIFLLSLGEITSTIKSDHILNLFEDLEGKWPEDKEKMVGILTTFLELDPHSRMIYQVGRRTGMMRGLSDLEHPERRAHAEQSCRQFDITPDNVDAAIDELMKRFI